MTQTHYQVLGVEPAATPEQIRRAYRSIAKQLHPDVNPSPDAAKRFARAAAAYEALSDPASRREYDRKLAARAPNPRSSTSDLRQGHYAWVNIASPRTGRPPDVSEIDDLFDTFFQRGGQQKPARTQQVPNDRAKKPAPKRPRSS